MVKFLDRKDTIMLSQECKIVYDVLREITRDDGVYKIIEAEEVLEKLPSNAQISKLQLSQIIRDLKDAEYVNVKYFTPDEYCLLTLRRLEQLPQAVEKDDDDDEKTAVQRETYDKKVKEPKPQKSVKSGVVFFMAMLGGMIGSAIVTALAFIIQRFI